MALIPPLFFDCVVSLGIKNGEGKIDWIGTGTIIARFNHKNDDGTSNYHFFIATNKHVLEGLDALIVRFNSKSDESKPSEDFGLTLKNEKGNLIWEGHSDDDIDLAVININPSILNEKGMEFFGFRSDMDILTIERMKEIGLSEGDFVYVLGFPMGIVGIEKKYVISRSGIIARIKDLFEGSGKEFIVDAFVFPGNSGGPVLCKPEVLSVTNTKSYDRSGLIGIVQSFIPYFDVAKSEQTKRARVIFEENSGLTSVIPTDFILETIENWLKKNKSTSKKTKKNVGKKK